MKDREDVIITKIEERDGWYDISTDQSTCFGLKKKYGVVPKKGDKITLYTRGFSFIRGMDLNGTQIFYKTDDELEQDRLKELAEIQLKEEAEFEENREQMDKDYAALPEVFRQRIDIFRNANEDFRKKFEKYELFCCRQAVAIAKRLKDPEKIEEWRDLEWDERVKQVPELEDGHSGNTFGTAVGLAFWYLKDPTQVPNLHGALTPLVGCKEYGCPHPRPEIEAMT